MGGGDLNLKKSWHPHTMKNQEKVWKAEQAKNEEERKLKDLRKEIEDEKNRDELKRLGIASGVLPKSDGDKKLEWMYKSSTELINREEYLLGRSVDKSFEMLQAEEQKKDQNTCGVKQPLNHVEHECIPFSIRAYRNMSSTEQVDLQRKVMEDPLMLIKQREMESRRKLLENPVKLKELHRILKTEQDLKKAKKCKKSKKGKKSKKKHKKHSKSSDSESSANTDNDSGNDLDKELEKRYKKLKGSLLDAAENGAGLSLSKLLDAKYETISKELDKAVRSKKKQRELSQRSRSNSADDNRNTNRYNTDKQRERQRRPAPRHRGRERSHDRRRSRSRSCSPARPDRKREKRSTRSRTHSNTRRDHGRAYSNRHLRNDSSERNRIVRNQPSRRSPPTQKTSKAPIPKSLSEAEKAARLREMMDNATWRETDRSQAVQKHRDAYAREEQHNKAQDFDKNFINKEMQKAIAHQTSVEARLRSNRNNIQRTSAALDSNFTRK